MVPLIFLLRYSILCFSFLLLMQYNFVLYGHLFLLVLYFDCHFLFYFGGLMWWVVHSLSFKLLFLNWILTIHAPHYLMKFYSELQQGYIASLYCNVYCRCVLSTKNSLFLCLNWRCGTILPSVVWNK